MRRTILLASAVTLTLWGCAQPAPDPRTESPTVAATTATAATGERRRFTGVVRARVESELGFRVAGKIVERLVQAGQTVRAGQALMRLDPTDLRLGAQGQAAEVAALRARAVQADADLHRLQGLVDQGAVSAQAYDQAKAAADAAHGQLDAAIAQSGVSENARRYALLAADADGVVEDTPGEVGQVVSPGQTVVRLAHAGPREAVVALPETLRPPLGARATATLYGAGEQTAPARLRQLSQSADAATRSFEARWVLDGAGAQAPLGTTVTVSLAGGAESDGVEVPLGAVYDPGSGPGVWRIANDRVQFQPVRLLALQGETARVGGLAPGARIVALGAERLREGQRVRTIALAGVETAGRP